MSRVTCRRTGRAAPLPGPGGPERGRTAGARAPRPFLKWAGGKSQLLTQFQPLFPGRSAIRRYIEPFVGSAAVFFRVRRLLEPRDVVLADGNAELINLYTAVRDDVEGLIRRLARHKREHCEVHYYRVRAQDPERLTPAARAARLIYLNKTCFNGLYRVNRRGQFNVPIGRHANPPILDAANLRAAAGALGGVALKVAHFAETADYARAGDFIYLDPPYHPISTTSSFTAYTDGAFREEDQRRLASVYARLARRGCYLMLSNSDSPLVRSLYRGFEIRKVQARRAINSRADRRGRVAEVVVLNYDPKAGAPRGRSPSST